MSGAVRRSSQKSSVLCNENSLFCRSKELISLALSWRRWRNGCICVDHSDDFRTFTSLSEEITQSEVNVHGADRQV
jgi:hypothetical protein